MLTAHSEDNRAHEERRYRPAQSEKFEALCEKGEPARYDESKPQRRQETNPI